MFNLFIRVLSILKIALRCLLLSLQFHGMFSECFKCSCTLKRDMQGAVVYVLSRTMGLGIHSL